MGILTMPLCVDIGELGGPSEVSMPSGGSGSEGLLSSSFLQCDGGRLRIALMASSAASRSSS